MTYSNHLSKSMWINKINHLNHGMQRAYFDLDVDNDDDDDDEMLRILKAGWSFFFSVVRYHSCRIVYIKGH